MALSKKEVKVRYWAKRKAEADLVPCACGCGGEVLSVDDYGRARVFINGHNTRKYPDKYGYKKAWIKRNRAWANTRRKRFVRSRKVKLILRLGSTCRHCGLGYNGSNGAAFELHHIEPSKKLFTVGGELGNKPFAVLKAEADKCILLCANCHNVNHVGEY